MKREVAVVILNYVQYSSIIPGIRELKKRGHSIDIYCPNTNADDGFKEMFDATKKTLQEKGFKVLRNLQNVKDDVLLEPYPCMDIEANFRVRYRYGTISAKPNLVYIPKNYLKYDAILCSGNYDSSYLNVFAEPYLVPSMKFLNFKKKKLKTNKKVLIYLPTYGESSSIDSINNQLEVLKKEYYIITKIHHGTTFLKSEKNRIDKIKKQSDEFYDCFKDIEELLSVADVVLTDNSGSIFECLYVKVPVASFSSNINQNRLKDFNTPQFELYKTGILPYTDDVNNIKNILKKAMSEETIYKQNKWANENLCYSEHPEKDFADVVEKYIKLDINKKYCQLHKILWEDYLHNENERNSLQYTNEVLKEEIEEYKLRLQSMNQQLSAYENGKLYKVSSKIYSILYNLRRK